MSYIFFFNLEIRLLGFRIRLRYCTFIFGPLLLGQLDVENPPNAMNLIYIIYSFFFIYIFVFVLSCFSVLGRLPYLTFSSYHMKSGTGGEIVCFLR